MFQWTLILARLLPTMLGVGMLAAIVWLFLHYRTKSELMRRPVKTELDELREDVNALRDRMARLEDVEERLADLTLQVDDMAEAALPLRASANAGLDDDRERQER